MRVFRNILVLGLAFLVFDFIGALVLYGTQPLFRYTSDSRTRFSELVLAIVSNIPLFIVLLPLSVLVALLVRPRGERVSAVVFSVLVLVTYVFADPVARNPFGFGFEMAVGTLLSAAIFVSLVVVPFLVVRRRSAAV